MEKLTPAQRTEIARRAAQARWSRKRSARLLEKEVKTQAEAYGLAHAIGTRSMDTLLRHETAIERKLYRAIDLLERLQRQRAGDYVPPPVEVGVSTDV